MSILIEAKRIEARHALLESLDNNNRRSYIQWETVGTYLREAALSPQQIQGLFGEIEKTATAGGSNRTGIGQAKDKVDQVIMKPWNDLKAKIYNSGPMEGFASKYEEAAEKLKASAGGDEGAVMKIITKYRAFAEKHPIMQGFIYAALIAAAGVSGAGLGGAAALGLFKLTDQLLQGKDVRSALYSAGKTGALAAGASTLGDLVRGGEGVADAGAEVSGITDVDTGSINDIVTDFDGKLSTAEMNMIQDLPNQDGIPQNVIDQYNAQLGPMYDEAGLNLADFKPGQPLSSEQMDGILNLQNQDAIPDDVIDQYNAQLQSHIDGGGLDQSGDIATVDGGGSAELDAQGNPVAGEYVDPEDIRGGSGQDFSKDAQGGSVADNIEQRKAELRAKADLVAPGGTGEGIVVRGDIPITDPELIDQFNSQFPGTEAMSPEATEWLRTNVDGAAENLDAKAAASADRLNKLTPAQLAKRNSLLQSGHSTNTNVLSEDQVAKLFIAVALGNHKLMEAPGLLQRAKAQIGKGVTAAAGKAKQIGTNLTTKVTADKLMKAWTKAGKPTDSIQVAQFLTNFGVDAAVLQQSYQTAGMKMPDIKKIATDDPVMALAQKINSNPAIKKQVIAYLQQAT